MNEFKQNKFNPCPISKLLITIFLAFSIVNQANDIFNLLIVLVFSVLFIINGRKNTALKITVFYVLLVLIFGDRSKVITGTFLDIFLAVFLIIKMFFLPVLSGKFLMSTSDVSSMIVSMEKMKFPRVIIIPIAVMFRYFPAFKDDKRSVKSAMKMRGITFKNPIKYLEYVSVPMLISAVGIADDISKAAETKCIADPCDKTRYFEVKFRMIDFVFTVLIVGLYIFGRIYA